VPTIQEKKVRKNRALQKFLLKHYYYLNEYLLRKNASLDP
jgi:hypothetical protein